MGVGKESKEIYLVLSEKNQMEDYTSGGQEINNSSVQIKFLSVTSLKIVGGVSNTVRYICQH